MGVGVGGGGEGVVGGVWGWAKGCVVGWGMGAMS